MTLLCFHGFGQSRGGRINLIKYDDRKIHYGMHLGVFSAVSRLTYTDYYATKDQDFVSIYGENGLGFSIGFIFNMRLKHRLWDLCLLPNVSLYERTVIFTRLDSTIVRKKNQATMIEVPIMLKFKSTRRRNARAYLMAGINPGIQIGNKKTDTKQTLNLSRYNLAITYGFGFHLYMQYFNFSPEIRISHGLTNLLDPVGDEFDRNIKRITTHRITLYLNFEG